MSIFSRITSWQEAAAHSERGAHVKGGGCISMRARAVRNKLFSHSRVLIFYQASALAACQVPHRPCIFFHLWFRLCECFFIFGTLRWWDEQSIRARLLVIYGPVSSRKWISHSSVFFCVCESALMETRLKVSFAKWQSNVYFAPDKLNAKTQFWGRDAHKRRWGLRSGCERKMRSLCVSRAHRLLSRRTLTAKWMPGNSQ